MEEVAFYVCPDAALRVAVRRGCVCSVSVARPAEVQAAGRAACSPSSPLLREALRQLHLYFAGGLRDFSLPLLVEQGTPFQQQVWQALRAIPYGECRTYGQIASAIGRSGASRAVGMACHRNPLLLLVPCHRVVGSSGWLGGFAAGLPLKRRLLGLEAAQVGLFGGKFSLPRSF